jgi:NADP-dependent 3-hydroxy acid dehydrogenase YdfG
MQNDRITGQVIMVTGASRGIGKAIVQALDAYHPRFVLVARTRDELEDLANSLESTSLILEADLLNFKETSQLIEKAVAHFGTFNTLINNAGIGGKVGVLPELPDEQLHRMVDLNLKVPMLLSKYAVAQFIAEGQGGDILQINSIAGKWAFPYWAVYDASKAGLHAFSEALGEEQRQNGTRVMSIYPGACHTAIWDSVDLAQAPDASGMLQASQVAQAVVFALSQAKNIWISDITLMPTKALL